MKCFLLFVSALIVGFIAGYYVAGHPTDTRVFLQSIEDSVGRLIHRN
jgi:hypothetical protein